MSRRSKQIVESDSEGEMREESPAEEESYSMDEEDLDDELQLPKELNNSVKFKEKYELLQFKRTHNELEWENAMMTRIEGLRKQKDMERLKQMTTVAGTSLDSGPSKKKKKIEKKKAVPVAPKKYTKGRGRKSIQDVEDVEFENEDDFEDDDIESEGGGGSEDDDDYESDDLFNEQEIVDISKQTKASTASGVKKQAKEDKTSKAGRKRSRLDDFDSSGGESDDEVEDWGEARSDDDENIQEKALKRKKKPSKSEDVEIDTSEIANLTDILKIQSRRVLVEKWHAEPYFADVVRGSLVRYFVGKSSSGEPIYRMAEVLDVIPMKPYKLADSAETTEQGLLISIGSSQTEAKLYKISNSRITQREYDEWMGALEKSNEQHLFLRKNSVEKRRKSIREASQHTYTHEEVNAMIQKNLLETSKHTLNYSHAMSMMKKKLESARNENDLDSMERIQKEMDKLEREVSFNREQYATRYRANTNINKRNKDRNIQMDMEAGVRKREMDMKKTKEEKRQNPFARRDTRPTILWVTGKLPSQEENAQKPELSSPGNNTKIPDEEKKVDLVEEKLDDIALYSENQNLAEVGMRIEKRFGFNPYVAAAANKLEKYLSEECKGLPPLGSEERNSLRGGLSLTQYLRQQEQQMVEAE